MRWILWCLVGVNTVVLTLTIVWMVRRLREMQQTTSGALTATNAAAANTADRLDRMEATIHERVAGMEQTHAAATALLERSDAIAEVVGDSCTRLIALEEWRTGSQIYTR